MIELRLSDYQGRVLATVVQIASPDQLSPIINQDFNLTQEAADRKARKARRLGYRVKDWRRGRR